MDEGQLPKTKATQEGSKEEDPRDPPASIFGKCNWPCNADEEEDGFNWVQGSYNVGSKLYISKAASSVLKREYIVDKEACKCKGTEESSEYHDGVRRWEIGADEQVLFRRYFPQISQIGKRSQCDSSDEFKHDLLVLTSITLQK